MMSERRKELLSCIGLFIVAIIWGLAFAVVKAALSYVTPVYMLAFRFGIASVLTCAVFFPRFKTMDKSTVKHGLIIGLFLFLAYLTQTLGCKYTTAGKNAFLTALYIIVVPFLHWILDKKRPALRLFFAAVIGIVGIGLLTLNGDRGVNIGDLLTILCGIIYAIQITLIDRYAKKEDPVALAMLQMLICFALGAVFAPVLEGPFPMGAMRADVWIGLLYLGIFSSFAGFLLQTVCQKYTKPESASLIMSTEAAWGVLGSVVFLHEIIGKRMMAGCIVMAAAILLAQINPERGKKEENEKNERS